jgi:hypothetical protein
MIFFKFDLKKSEKKWKIARPRISDEDKFDLLWFNWQYNYNILMKFEKEIFNWNISKNLVKKI